MKNIEVGKIKNIRYSDNTFDLEVTIVITDSKFKKKLLRDLSLQGLLHFNNNKLIYTDNIEDHD
jgi:hypothetical protein